MIKTHDVIGFISNSIGDAVNPDEIIIVDTEVKCNKLEVTFTEKDMTKTKYRVTVELVEDKKENESLPSDDIDLSDDDKDIIKRNSTWTGLI